jgi:hypothetical protein
MFLFPRLDLRSASESVLVFVISLVAVSTGVALGQPVVAWLALAGFSGFIVKWLIGMRNEFGIVLAGFGGFLAGLVGLYCMMMVMRALEAMG